MEQIKKGSVETWSEAQRYMGINLETLSREDKKKVLASISDCMLLSELANRLLKNKQKIRRMTEALIEE